MGIYVIENTLNGRVYVGSSATLNKRINQHASRIRTVAYSLPERLKRDVEEYGPDAFRIRVLQRTPDARELEKLERQWADYLEAHGERGYNTNPIVRGAIGRSNRSGVPSTNHVGGRICALRMARGMSQWQLAELIGVAQSYISEIETSGEKSEGMSVRQLRRFAEGVGVKPVVLLDQDEYEKALSAPLPASAGASAGAGAMPQEATR